jgi:hypothetical protein
MKGKRRISPLVVAGLALVVSLTVSLTGCAPGETMGGSDDATPTVTASATPSVSATPTPTVAVAEIVVGMTGLTVKDSTGTVVEELSYATPGIDVANRLTKIFGADPVVTDSAGNNEVWPSRDFVWSGFTLHDEMRTAAKAVWYEYYVRVEVASVNGVAIRTAAGVQVGDPASSVTYNPSDLYRSSWNGESCGVETWFSEDGNIGNGVFLNVCTLDTTGLVTRFSVPVQLHV